MYLYGSGRNVFAPGQTFLLVRCQIRNRIENFYGEMTAPRNGGRRVQVLSRKSQQQPRELNTTILALKLSSEANFSSPSAYLHPEKYYEIILFWIHFQ